MRGRGSLHLQGRPPETSCLSGGRPCKCKLPRPRIVFHSTQTRQEGGNPPLLCFSSQCGRSSAHSTTKRVNVNVSIDHPRGIPFTLNNMLSSHVVFDVTRVLTYSLLLNVDYITL